MEPRILAHLEKSYPALPAFIYGSRVDGYSNNGSDWDIGVIGAKKGMRIKGLVDFSVINVNNLDKKAVRNIHNRDMSFLSKRIEPIRDEKIVEETERRAKQHIIGYVAQRLGTTSISGRDVVLFYQRENAELNPFYKLKYLRFIQSKKAVRNVAEVYDDILQSQRFLQQFRYRTHHKIDAVSTFVEKSVRLFREGSDHSLPRVLNFASNLIRNYSKAAMKESTT